MDTKNRILSAKMAVGIPTIASKSVWSLGCSTAPPAPPVDPPAGSSGNTIIGGTWFTGGRIGGAGVVVGVAVLVDVVGTVVKQDARH